MNILEFLKDNIVVLDGGMGTLLQSAGLAAGERPERWNISHPEVTKFTAITSNGLMNVLKRTSIAKIFIATLKYKTKKGREIPTFFLVYLFNIRIFKVCFIRFLCSCNCIYNIEHISYK